MCVGVQDVEKLQRRITEAAEMPILPRGQAKGSQEAMDDPIDKLFQNFTVAGQVVQKMRSVATSLISNILHAQSSEWRMPGGSCLVVTRIGLFLV